MRRHQMTEENRGSVREAFVVAACERAAALPIQRRSDKDVFMPCPNPIAFCTDCISRWYTVGERRNA